MFILRNKGGMEVHISSMGCIIQRLHVPDRKGAVTDVVLGYEDIATYQVGPFLV